MAKFTFPLPHRRQKAEAPPPLTISAPLSKVQKILGSEDIPRDSPTLPEDQSKHWETHSSLSGISISVSESSTSHVGSYNTGLLGLGDARGLRPPRNRVARGPAWEQESEIIPRIKATPHSGTPRSPGETAIDPLDMTTDASSLRRQQSSSTIVSFYDKSKVPLSISQQTSNSAMAKGFPSKASELLDMEGGVPQMPPMKERKKPARLDLTHLLPKSRFASHSSSPPKELVLGADALTKSPSMLSLSSGPISGTHSPVPTEKKLRKKLTKESLRSLRTRKSSHFEPPVAATCQRRVVNETAGLHSLYEHYENITLKDVADDAEEVAGATEVSRGQPATSDDALSPGLFRRQPTSGSSQTASSSKGSSLGVSSRTDTPATASLSPPSLISVPGTDCAASISSRNTRTSKASKKTDQSFSDFDPRVNSVLSLSSDSEEEFPPPPKTAASVPDGNRRSASLAPSEPPRPRTSRSANSQNSHTPGSSHSKSSTGSSPILGRQYLGVPTPGQPISRASPPVVTARTSSLTTTGTHSTHSVKSSKTASPSSRASSQLSMRSTSTANSVATNLKPPRPQSHQIPGQEARPIAVVPPYQSSHSAQQHPHNSRHRSSSRGSSQASLAEPPISPTSVEFYLRSQHGSILEFDSLPMGGVHNAAAVAAAAQQQATNDGRFMAVTKQEEMLLAALRLKRAHMRENSPELDDHEQLRSDSRMSALSEQPQKPSARSSSSTATLRDTTPRPSSRVGSRARASSHSDPTHTRPTPPPPRPSDKREQILLYLDRPAESVHTLDAAEPSPDLSDFMDFDDGSNGSDEFPMPPTTARSSVVGGRETPSSAENVRLAPRTYLSPFPRPAGASRRSSGAGTPFEARSISRSISPQSFPRKAALRDEDVQVRILETQVEGVVEDDGGEHGADVPRPDSPIGPGGTMGFPPEEVRVPLPRKKAVRISAVGHFSNALGVGWWDDRG